MGQGWESKGAGDNTTARSCSVAGPTLTSGGSLRNPEVTRPCSRLRQLVHIRSDIHVLISKNQNGTEQDRLSSGRVERKKQKQCRRSQRHCFSFLCLLRLVAPVGFLLRMAMRISKSLQEIFLYGRRSLSNLTREQ